MTRLILTFTFLVSCVLSTPAQEYEEYYPEGTTWVNEWYVDGWRTQYRRSTIAGDTVIDSKVYKKLICEESEGGVNETYAEKEDRVWKLHHVAGVREEAGNVYYYNIWKHKEVMKYDFGSWGTSNQYFWYYSENYDVNVYQRCDTLRKVTLLDGKEYEYMDYSWDYFVSDYPYSHLSDIYRIRTIGTLQDYDGIIESWGSIFWNGAWQYEHMVYFKRNGVIIYDHDTIVGHSMSDIRSLERDGKQADGAIYDLQGRRLTEKPQRGLYIMNGKKYKVQ